jgi:hypothetical protein
MRGRLATLFDKVIGRRSFFGRISAGATALFGSLVGLSISTKADYYYGCCDLLCQSSSNCKNPCSPYCGTVDSGGYDCSAGGNWLYCYECCDVTAGVVWQCIENFPTPNEVNCTYGCSQAILMGTASNCSGTGPGPGGGCGCGS